MHESQIEETISSLRFAKSAKLIQNKVRVNISYSIHNNQLKNMVRSLKKELDFAKSELSKIVSNSRDLSGISGQARSGEPAAGLNMEVS